jgi:hypothetical protein
MVVFISLQHSYFSCSRPKFKRYCLGGRNVTSTTLIVDHPAARPVTSPHLPLAVAVAASVGDLAMVPSSSPWPAIASRGTLVPKGSTPEALESPMLQVQEVLTRPMQDGSNATLLHDVLVREELDAHGASLGIVSIEVDGADPRSGDSAGALPHDLVVRGAGLGMPKSAAPGDTISAPSPWVSWARGQPACSCRVPPSSLLPPIDWRQVEDNIEFTCS